VEGGPNSAAIANYFTDRGENPFVAESVGWLTRWSMLLWRKLERERENEFVCSFFFTIELEGFEFVERIRERQQRPMRIQQ
jgi:hypothetical protein